jgi:hypothetical protein
MKVQITIPAQSIEIDIEATTDPVNPPPPPPVDTTGFKVGSCTFPWFPQSRFADIGLKWQRVYCSSGWIWRPDGIAVQPMHQAETEENHGLDDMLTKAKSFGINTLLCCHQTPEWYRNTGRGDGANDYAPVKAGANLFNPGSYKDYAEMLFQISARYGRVKHQDSSLRVDTNPRWSGDVLNVKKSGLDLLAYLEIWNEPDKWWKIGTPESDAYFAAEETAAFMSACYDGHEGRLGAGVGIKTADPSMQVVMPGITDFNPAYIAKMDTWFKANRIDKGWPCDYLNFHHYSNRGNKKDQYPAQWVQEGACLPKDDANFVSVRGSVDFAASMGKKCWVTELGADKRSPSGMTAVGVGKLNEAFQAEIIIESIKAYKLAGVDAVFVFNSCDENSGTDGGQYESSGIFTSQMDGFKPTAASEALKAYLKPTAATPRRTVSKPESLPKMSESKRPGSK